jgi:hypothetical protein
MMTGGTPMTKRKPPETQECHDQQRGGANVAVKVPRKSFDTGDGAREGGPDTTHRGKW